MRLRLLSLVFIFLFFSRADAEDDLSNLASIDWENDLLAGTDGDYTNGLRISWSNRNQKNSVWWLPDDLMMKLFPRCSSDQTECFHWWTGLVMGQSIYTPQNLRATSVIQNDRPYAGLCYGGPTFAVIRHGTEKQKAMQHSLELLVGAIGEPSLAEEAQRFVHEHFAKRAVFPQGWSHQIATEVTLNLHYSGARRELEFKTKSNRIFDVASEWTAAAGNAFVFAGGGGTIRIGWNVGDDFSASRMEPIRTFDKPANQDWELYGFFRFTGRYVAHNITLSGGWFAESEHTVNEKDFVRDVEIGTTLRIKPVLFSFRWVQRSPEFHEREITQKFVGLNLTILF